MSSYTPTQAAELALAAVNNDRLQQSIADLARFGGRSDGGVSRETLTEIDRASRRHLIEQARALGCEVHVDACANLFFRRAGLQNDLTPVLTGSHGDTQPIGGQLDGAYGVLAGLEVLAALNDANITTLRPIEVVAWTNEEGSRFGPGTMGSSAFVQPERLNGYLNAKDKDHILLSDALAATLAEVADVPPCAMQRPMAACVELHIEQGPVLEDGNIPLATVHAIQAVRWFNVTCHGAMSHAGTTPMEVRQDAMACAVAIASQLYAFAGQEAASQLRLTLGRWQVVPNSVNTIPGQVQFTVDMRCIDDAVLDRFEAFLKDVTGQASCPTTVDCFFQRATTHFSPEIIAVVDEATAYTCKNADRAAPIRMASGAFHDAMYMADHCPSAMIFVPSIKGISHNPAEATHAHDLLLGAQALTYTVTKLANQQTI